MGARSRVVLLLIVIVGLISLPASAAATLSAPAISAQPDIGIVKAGGELASFTANATGVPTPQVHWEVAPGRDGPWSLLFRNPTVDSRTLEVTANASNLGDAYRAVFTSSAGTVVSRPAKLVSKMDWMRDLGSDVEKVPLNELTIPGAHDMGTYGLGSSSSVSLDGQSSDLDCTIHSVCVSYARAQDPSNTATEMLGEGMRYFDLRVCGNDTAETLDVPANWTEFTQNPVTCHGLDGALLAPILADTRTFALAHPKEVVILDVNHEYQVDLYSLAKQIEAAFALPGGESLMIPPQYCETGLLDSGQCASYLTLGRIWHNHLGNVIVNFENDGAPGEVHLTQTGPLTFEAFHIQPIPNYSFYDSFPNLWGRLNEPPNAMKFCTESSGTSSCFGNSPFAANVNERVQNTIATRATFTDTRHFFVQFVQTTPTTKFILENPGGSLLNMAVDPEEGSNPYIGPSLFACPHGPCFAQLRPENLNIVALNFYDRTNLPAVHYPLSEAEEKGCYEDVGPCDLTPAQLETVSCFITCIRTEPGTFDFVEQIIRFDEFARTPPVVEVGTRVKPAASGWYDATALGRNSELLFSVSAHDYSYPTGLTAMSCLDGGTPVGLLAGVPTSATSAIGVAYLSDGVHSISCEATDGADQGFHEVGNPGAGPGSRASAIFKVDLHPPSASPTALQPPNAAGWNSSKVTVDWNWSDGTGGSGIDPAHCTTASVASGVGTITLKAACQDIAGNIGSATYAVKVAGPPAVTISSPHTGGVYVPGQIVKTAYSCSDAAGAPGILSCGDSNGAFGGAGQLNTSEPGEHVYAVTARSKDGEQQTAQIGYRVLDLPTVSSLTPNAGPVAGGTEIKVKGTAFIAGAVVKLTQGTLTPLVATEVHVSSSTELTAVTAAAPRPGVWNVTVMTSKGSSPIASADRFLYAGRPTLTSVSPASGANAGGTAITLKGTNFVAGAKVEIPQGGTPIAAKSVRVISPTEITAITGGPAKGGTWKVYVITAGGLATGPSFTYVLSGALARSASEGLGLFRALARVKW